MKIYMFVLVALAMLLYATVSLAGTVRGPRYADGIVNPNSSDYYTETLIAYETTYINLSGNCIDPAQDIDLWVYDENNNLITKSTTYGCNESVVVIPRWTGPFRIVIENTDKPYSTDYHLTIE